MSKKIPDKYWVKVDPHIPPQRAARSSETRAYRQSGNGVFQSVWLFSWSRTKGKILLPEKTVKVFTGGGIFPCIILV